MAPMGTLAAGVGVSLASTVMVEAVKGLYGISESLNDYFNRHIESMKDHENPTIFRTGRVLEMAKFGFGLGYVSPVIVIAAGQVILGNPLAAAAAVGSAAMLANPVAMTCGAVGAVYYGWWALTDQERNELLEKLQNGLQVGAELIKAVINFVIEITKGLLNNKNFEEMKKYVASIAATFGKPLGDITHKLGDIVNDSIHAVQDSAGRVIDKTEGFAVSAYSSVKVTAGRTFEATGDALGKLKFRRSTQSRQNRVDPFGELISTKARGLFMGNRGILHDDHGSLTSKRWTHNHWITCQLEFKGRKRELMDPGSYTELFFLDETVALAAGHRPCAECRREDFNRFKAAWVEGNAYLGFTGKTAIGEIDRFLHKERVARDRRKITYQDQLGNLPEGAFFTLSCESEGAFLVWEDSFWKWSPHGYEEAASLEREAEVGVLTPASTIMALRAGYVPTVARLGGQI